jgi:xanthine dehydrogenase iron-sulfur cluster and FAD-binding subunit A
VTGFEEIRVRSVKTLDELFTTIGSVGTAVYQLSAGNTAEGVYRHFNRQFDARIDVKDVPELRTVSTAQGFTVGANVTLTEAIAALKQQASTAGYAYLNDIAAHLDKVANTPVRNV